jgi:hypothetical protein
MWNAVKKELYPGGIVDPTEMQLVDEVRDVWYKRSWEQVFEHFLGLERAGDYPSGAFRQVKRFVRREFRHEIDSKSFLNRPPSDLAAHVQRIAHDAFESA